MANRGKEKGKGGREKEKRGKRRDGLPYDLGDLEMTWLLLHTGPQCQG